MSPFVELIAFLSLAVVLYVTTIISRRMDHVVRNSATYIRPVHDLYHSNYDTYLIRNHWIVDVICGITWLCWASVVTWQQTINTVISLTLMYLIRLISISTTYGYVSPRFIQGGVSDRHVGANCFISDLTISGHVSTVTIMCADMLKYGNYWQKIIACVLNLAAIYCNLANGDHYTSDVFLGLVISMFITSHTYY